MSSLSLETKSVKYRYDREDMINIYDKIEHVLIKQSPLDSCLIDEFEELFKKNLQKPIFSIPISDEEKVFHLNLNKFSLKK